MFVGRVCTKADRPSPLVAAIIPHIATSELGRFVQLLGIMATQRGYTLLLGVTSDIPEIEKQFIEQVVQFKPLGLLKFPTNVELEEETRSRLRRHGVPYIIINDFWTDCQKDHHLAYDECLAVELALQHLVELGHRRIALVDYRGWMRTGIAATFTNEMQRHGLDTDEKCHVHIETNADNIQVVHGLGDLYCAGRLKPTAFITVYDIMAVSLVSELHVLGLKVPRDVSVVNLNGRPTVDMPFGLDLATAVPPNKEIIDMALDMLTDGLKDGRTHHVTFQPAFYIGSTTGPCRERLAESRQVMETRECAGVGTERR